MTAQPPHHGTGSLAGAQPLPRTKPGFLALIRLGRLTIGVDVNHIREVIPVPTDFLPIPGAGGEVLGAVVLRGQVIPVLDLLGLMGATDAAALNVVVILRAKDRLFGFLAQSTMGIVPRAEAQIQTRFEQPITLLQRMFPESLLHQAQVINRLDPEPMLEIAGLPSVSDGARSAVDRDLTHHLLLFETDGVLLCLPIKQVDAIIPYGPITTGSMTSGLSDGAVELRGLVMCMIDPVATAGLRHPNPRTGSAAGIVVRFGENARLALRTDKVRDILRVSGDKISAFPPTLTRNRDLISGVVLGAGQEQQIVLNTDALRADPQLQSYAQMAHLVGSDIENELEAAKGDSDVVVIFQAGGDFALPISEVEEILALPPEIQSLDPAGDGHLLNLSHRGRMIPIYSAAIRLGMPFVPPTERPGILVLRQGDIRYGMMVERLQAIEPALRRYANRKEAEGGQRPQVVQLFGKRGTGLLALLSRDDLIPEI